MKIEIPAAFKRPLAIVVGFYIVLLVLTRGAPEIQRKLVMDGLLELLFIGAALLAGIPVLYAFALGAAYFVTTVGWQVVSSRLGGGSTGSSGSSGPAERACRDHGGVQSVAETSGGTVVGCRDGTTFHI
jgi:hypothetical protein